MSNFRSRRFAFTLNNYTENDLIKLKGFIINKITYICFGKEVGEKNGTPHLQGYLELKDAKTWTALKKSIGINALHLKVANGSGEENKNYCMKEVEEKEDWFEKGTMKNQGKRTDLETIVQDIEEGTRVEDICLSDPVMYHQYGRTFHKIEDILMRRKFRTWMTTCDWYFGPTGIGKSKEAYENFDPETHYNWKKDNGWQDGYTGQPIVIINEFRGNIPYSELLELIDRQPFELRRRGREPAPFLAKHIIITSALEPCEIYKNLSINDSLDQLYRRIKLYTKNKLNEDWKLVEKKWIDDDDLSALD